METIITESRSNSTGVVKNHWKKRSTFFPGYEDARKRCWFLVASTIYEIRDLMTDIAILRYF